MTQGVGNYKCNSSSLFTLTAKPADFFFQNGQNSLYNVMLTRAVNILKVGQLVSTIDPTIAQTKKKCTVNKIYKGYTCMYKCKRK